MKYLLDTNVVSQLRRADRIPAAVVAWSRSTAPHEANVSVITLMEIERGIRKEEAQGSAKGRELRYWADTHVYPAYGNRCLAVTRDVAVRAASFFALPTVELADHLIAATALVHDLIVVTRNVRHFAPMGVRLLNPWDP